MSIGPKIICVLCTTLLAAVPLHPTKAHTIDRIRASALLGAPVQTRGGAQLGVVSDLLIDTARDRISFVAVRADPENGSVRAVPWSAVDWSSTGSSKYAAMLSTPDSVESRYDVAAATPGTVDFSTSVQGRPVRAGNGVIVGQATDLVIDMPSGTPVDLLAEMPGVVQRGTQASIPWADVADFTVERPIDVILDPSEIETAPSERLSKLPSGARATRSPNRSSRAS